MSVDGIAELRRTGALVGPIRRGANSSRRVEEGRRGFYRTGQRVVSKSGGGAPERSFSGIFSWLRWGALRRPIWTLTEVRLRNGDHAAMRGSRKRENEAHAAKGKGSGVRIRLGL